MHTTAAYATETRSDFSKDKQEKLLSNRGAARMRAGATAAQRYSWRAAKARMPNAGPVLFASGHYLFWAGSHKSGRGYILKRKKNPKPKQFNSVYQKL